MIRFCKRFFIVCIPIMAGILAIHLFVSLNPAMFRNKAKFTQSHKEDIEVIFLGSSHTQEGINPLLMKNICTNLAYNSQDVVANCMLFDKYIEELPNLKFVIFEFDYFTLEQPLDQAKINDPLYRKFHNLPKTSLYNQFTSIFGDIPFFKNYIYESLKYMKNGYQVNDAGYVTQSSHNPFRDLKFDSIAVIESAPKRLTTRHKARYIDEIKTNTDLIDSLIVKAKSKDIQVIFLSIPKYKTYIEREIPDKLSRRANYLEKKLKNKEVLYYDYEKDHRFKDVNMYLDDNHLGLGGTKKFTLIIDSLITTLK